MLKKFILILLVAVTCSSFTAYALSDDDLGFDDTGGYTETKNQYSFNVDETILVENKEAFSNPEYDEVYAGSEIYIPIYVYPDNGRDEVHASDKMIKTDAVTVSSKVLIGKDYVGDITIVDGKKAKIDGLEAGAYACIPFTPEYANSGKTTISVRLVLSVNDVTYQLSQIAFKCYLRNRETDIRRNSVYGAKSPTQYRVMNGYSGEVTFDFGNKVKYTTTVKKDATYYLNLSKTPDEAIKKMYPDAYLEFYDFKGEKDTFAKIGKLEIPVKQSNLAKKDEQASLYVYRVDGDSLTSLGAGITSFDSKTDTLTINTRKLDKYVLSNQALKRNVDDEDNNILKSGYASVTNSQASEIAASQSSTASSSGSSAASSTGSSAASSQVEVLDTNGYAAEETSYPNDNVNTGLPINASNKSADNPNTSDLPLLPLALAGLAFAPLTLLAARKAR